MRRSDAVAAEAVLCLNKALMFLRDVWEQIGIPEPQRLERTKTVKEHIQGLLDMMIAEEESLKHRLEQSVKSSRAEIHRLREELELAPPQQEQEVQTLLEQEESLRRALEELKEEKRRRREQLQTLLLQDQEMAALLGTAPFTIHYTHPLSSRPLEELQLHLANQQREQVQRQAQFQTLREQILVLVSDLDHSLDSDLDQFNLSLQSLQSLEQLQSQLQQQRSDLEDQSRLIQDQIQTLWNRLETPQNQQDAFTHSLPQEKVRQRVTLLQEEAERLEKVKLSNIRSVSDRIRAEISELWEKCFCSEEQRLGLTVFYTDQVSERVLEALEAELQHLKQFYDEHRLIMEAVQMWMDQWEQFLELERKASDPSRFTNRGGNLLKEQRQRTELSKSLHQLERVLRSEVALWEQTHKSQFLVKGLNFFHFVEQQWNLLQQQKEQEKTIRHLKKARETQEDMMYGTTIRTPAKRRFISTNSPNQVNTGGPNPGCSVQSLRGFNRTRTKPLGGCSLSTNSTLRSVTGQVCFSPGPCPLGTRPPQVPMVRTPVRPKPPQPRVPALNQNQSRTKAGLNQDQSRTKTGLKQAQVWTQEQKENRPQTHPQSQTLGSVASTYSQFLRDLSEFNAKVHKQVLNSTDL